MSTRSVITFKDEYGSFSIYKHYDGYPSGVLAAIKEATLFAWGWPRYEASDFSAAFVRANKTKGGDIYLTTGHEAHGDLDYDYVVQRHMKGLKVSIFKHEYNAAHSKEREPHGVEFVEMVPA